MKLALTGETAFGSGIFSMNDGVNMISGLGGVCTGFLVGALENNKKIKLVME